MPLSPPLVWVVGDAMADVTVTSPKFRRTPEDPTVLALPAPDPTDRTLAVGAGGAANVAANLAAMRCRVRLLAAVDLEDGFGTHLAHTLTAAGVALDARPAPGTTAKVRYVEGRRLVGRVDYDHTAPNPILPPTTEPPENCLPAAVCLCDHGRGTVDAASARAWVRWCHSRGVAVYADPKVGRQGVWDGTAVDVMVANWEEATGSRGGVPDVDPTDDGWAKAVAASCRASWGPFACMIVKRGAYGSVVAFKAPNGPADGRSPPVVELIPPVAPKAVYDVQGAGDTYLAGLVTARCRGASLADACLFASAAAGVAVGRPGTAVVDAASAAAALVPVVAGPRGVVSRDEAAALAARFKSLGLVVGLTNGCFRLLGPGHVASLAEAGRRCDFLFVAVDSDARVEALKGETLVAADRRAAVVAGVAGVGAAFVFDEDPGRMVLGIRPDRMLKGMDYCGREVAGSEYLSAWAGRLELLPLLPGEHTTEVVARIRKGSNA